MPFSGDHIETLLSRHFPPSNLMPFSDLKINAENVKAGTNLLSRAAGLAGWQAQPSGWLSRLAGPAGWLAQLAGWLSGLAGAAGWLAQQAGWRSWLAG